MRVFLLQTTDFLMNVARIAKQKAVIVLTTIKF